MGNEEGYIPPVGKHNLYRAMILYADLFMYKEQEKDGEMVSEHHNNFEILQSKLEFLEDSLPLIVKGTANKELEDQFKESLGYIRNLWASERLA